MIDKFAEILDRVSEVDRAYFKNHPEAKEYVRALIPGEFRDFPACGIFVRVIKVTDSIRNRQPGFMVNIN